MPIHRMLLWIALGASLAALSGCVQPSLAPATGGSVDTSGAANGVLPAMPAAPVQRGPKDTLGGGPVG